MDTREFVALVLLAAGDEVQGKTKLQKLSYFLGLLTDNIDELGYRAHFYGPYSDDVANAVTQLRTIGAIDQNVSDWGYDRSGFELKRYDFRLNEPGKRYAINISRRFPESWRKIQNAVSIYDEAGDVDYMELSIAAKAYFLLGQKSGKPSTGELARLAPRFGWNVREDQIDKAAQYLQKLGLVEVRTN